MRPEQNPNRADYNRKSSTSGREAQSIPIDRKKTRGRLSHHGPRPEKLPILVTIFIISLAIPISIYVGPIRLSPYRIILIALFIPLLSKLLSGRAGPIRKTDTFIILFACWAALSLFVTTEFAAAIEPAGILIVETAGAYLVGRTLVRTQDQFIALSRFLFLLLTILLPFAIYESITDRPIILDFLRPFFNVANKGLIDPRFGLHRSQVVFEHPIIYGIFTSSLFSIIYYTNKTMKTSLHLYAKYLLTIIVPILSVSTGAVAALFTQLILISWDHITKGLKNRWRIISIMIIIMYVTVDLVSNRSPFHVFVSYLTFSSVSAYNRILIWNYGSAEVMRNPIFGIGLEDWIRPSWMSSSMDNFWLLITVRYGLPAFIFLSISIFYLIRDISRMKFSSNKLNNIRSGILISLVSLIFAGATVHYWNAILCWLFFIVGSILWLLDKKNL